MSVLSVVKEALEIVDTIGKLPTSPETFMSALDAIFQVVSVILRTDGQAGWYQKVNEVMGKEVLSVNDENRLQPLVNFLMQIKNPSAIFLMK